MRRTRALSRRRPRNLLPAEDDGILPEEVSEVLDWATPQRLMRVADDRLDLPATHPALHGLLGAMIADVRDYEERGWDRQHSLERLRSHIKHVQVVVGQDWVREGLEREPELVCGLLAQLVVQHPAYEDEGVLAISDPLYRTTRRRRRPR